jgi:hypothetical protein
MSGLSPVKDDASELVVAEDYNHSKVRLTLVQFCFVQDQGRVRDYYVFYIRLGLELLVIWSQRSPDYLSSLVISKSTFLPLSFDPPISGASSGYQLATTLFPDHRSNQLAYQVRLSHPLPTHKMYDPRNLYPERKSVPGKYVALSSGQRYESKLSNP